MKIGIMGASFDPPHRAHLAVAEAARAFLGLDRVVFVPAFSAPLKARAHAAGFEDRLAMLRLALLKFPAPHEISTLERDRGGTSYSVDTARALAAANPGAELFWIIGADQLLQLHKWREVRELSGIVTFAALGRPGYPFGVPPEAAGFARVVRIPSEEEDVSSTKIRASLENMELPLDLVDAEVLNYIRENKLYNHG